MLRAAGLARRLPRRWGRAWASSEAPAPEDEPEKRPKGPGVRRLLELYGPEKRDGAVALGALAVSTAITVCIPAGMGHVIDVIASGATEPSAELGTVTGGLGALFALGAAANVTRVTITNTLGERITARLRERTYGSILAKEMAFFDDSRTGELVTRLTADTSLVGKVLTDNVSSGLRSVAQAIGGVSMMLYTSPALAGIVLMVVPPMSVGAVAYGRYVKSLSQRVQDELGRTSEVAEEKLSNMRTVRWFGQEAAELSLYRSVSQGVFDLARIRARASGLFFGAVDLSVKMSMLGVMWYGGTLVMEGAMTVGELTSFLMYTLYCGFSAAGVSSFYGDLMKGVGASQRVFQLLDATPGTPPATATDAEVEEMALARDAVAAAKPVPSGPGRIDFCDVTFRYPGRPDAPVLSGLSLSVEPGETLALVGSSGSGKSTVPALLARLYEVDGGAIKVDGVDVTDMDPTVLRRQIGVVMQDPTLFHGSIADNIRYGAEDLGLSHEAVVAAAEKANAAQFIAALPEGYDTIVGERGSSLSGGQRQRVAIARALLREPRFLVLDEATSALDPESEALVHEALLRLMEGRTVLMVSHRLSAIRGADRVALLSGGAIVETGTYDALAADPHSEFSKVIARGHL